METIKNMQTKYSINDTKRAEKALFSLWSNWKRKTSEISERFYSNKRQQQTKVNKFINNKINK